MSQELKNIIEDYVDLLLPELTTYEASLYIFLLRNSLIKKDILEIRIGKRTIASSFVKGLRGNRTNSANITKILKGLEEKECIHIGDVNREGTLYKISLPKEVPLVAEKIAVIVRKDNNGEDYFTDPNKRREIFEQDKWTCFYCGEKITIANATLDHFIPQKSGGKHTKDNLKTTCIVCNSIKTDKTYEEAAPLLLKGFKKEE